MTRNERLRQMADRSSHELTAAAGQVAKDYPMVASVMVDACRVLMLLADRIA